MINRAAIDKFLNAKRDDYGWLKRCSRKSLEAAIAEMKPPPEFGTIKPWNHQLACLLLLDELKRFTFHIDMGGGKSLLSLLLLKYRKQRGEQPRAIVFVPYITSVETWVEEVNKHCPDLRCVPLLGSTEQNLNRLQGEGDLFVICYQSAVAMVSEPEPSKKKRGKTKWNFKASQIREYFAGFDMIIMDEIHRAKSVKSLSYRMCRAISAQAEYALGLTGTPFDRDLADLWPQFYLIDFGETLGTTLGFFRAVFFKEKSRFFGPGLDYKFDKKLLPELKRIIKHSSIAYNIDEFYDMPPKEYFVKSITLPEGTHGYVDTAIKRIQEAVKGTGNNRYQVIESNYLQLRQLSSGFITLKGEDSARLQVKFDENPKMDVLIELAEAMPSGSKMVVFHHFRYSNGAISERLTEAGIKHARIWGGAKDPIGELRRFKNDAKCRVLVLNSKSGSSSLNLQNANYVVFYEQPDSGIDRQQCERRCWRPGQTKRVMYYDLLVKGTVDGRIYKNNKSGANLLKSLLSGKEKL